MADCSRPRGDGSPAHLDSWLCAVGTMRPPTLFLCFLFLLISAAAPAQQPTTPTLAIRVGFVDMEIVLGESVSVRRIMTEIDQELAAAEEEIGVKRREARRMRLALDQQGTVLSETERLRRQQEIIDLLAEVDEMTFRFDQRFRDAQRGAVEPLLVEVIRVVGEVARRDGYDLVVRGEMVLYGKETVDLTPSVIAALDGQEAELRRVVLPGLMSSGEPPKQEGISVLPLIP